MTHQLLVENVQDANYTWTDEPFSPDYHYSFTIQYSGLMMTSEDIRKFKKYQTVINELELYDIYRRD